MEVFSLLDSSPIVLSYRIVDFKYWETPYQGLYPRQMFQKLVRHLSARHVQVLQGGPEKRQIHGVQADDQSSFSIARPHGNLIPES
jgi:hypothetical protein